MDNHTQELALQNGNIAVSVKRWSGIWLVALVVAGCATANLGRSDKEIVAQRAQLRWDELVKGDFAAAYRFISPAGREIVTPDSYAAGLKRGFWSSAKVEKVECPSADACEVEVWIEYKHWGVKMRAPVREKWVRQRFDWWFVVER
jgi:hypothetical protein